MFFSNCCRIHAEFQLNDPPYYPFWFTPAQFKGNLIISRDGSHIEYFHMYVPTDKRLNIGMFIIAISKIFTQVNSIFRTLSSSEANTIHLYHVEKKCS